MGEATPRRSIPGHVARIVGVADQGHRAAVTAISHGRVGWVERSDTHQMPFAKMMGIASLHPSYELRIIPE
jgi:hypothetical protein